MKHVHNKHKKAILYAYNDKKEDQLQFSMRINIQKSIDHISVNNFKKENQLQFCMQTFARKRTSHNLVCK